MAVEQKQSKYDTLLAELKTEKMKNQQLTLEIEQLKHHNLPIPNPKQLWHDAQTTSMNSMVIRNTKQTTPLSNTTTPPINNGPASSNNAPTMPKTWAHATAQFRPSNPATVERRRLQATRVFSEPTGERGYEYVHIPRSRRLTRPEARRLLRRIGVDTARILDISYPAKNTIGLLTHVQYKAELEEANLTKHKVQIQTSFDPHDPDTIADRKHADLPKSERRALATTIHRDRCIRTLQYLRRPIAIAVARSFVEKGWIGEQDVPAHKFYDDRDDPSRAFRTQNSGDEIPTKSTSNAREAIHDETMADATPTENQ